MEQYSIRFPASLAAEIRELAALSNNGLGMSFTRYINAIAREAADRDITITEVQTYDLSGSLAGVGESLESARQAAEDAARYRAKKKKQDKRSA